MTVTVQKKVADRIVARPGVKDYGGLAIWVQGQCRADDVAPAGAVGLLKRPKVSSAFLQITLDETLRQRIPNRTFFHAFVPHDVPASPQGAPRRTAQKTQAVQRRPRSTNCWPAWD